MAIPQVPTSLTRVSSNGHPSSPHLPDELGPPDHPLVARLDAADALQRWLCTRTEGWVGG